MLFEERQPTYLQIAEHICEQIMNGHRQEQERLPSVREMSVALKVNPSIVTRTYDYLQNAGIIGSLTDFGYHVQPDASQRIQRLRRAQFISYDMPKLLRKMKMLGMDFSDLERLYQEYSQMEGSPKQRTANRGGRKR